MTQFTAARSHYDEALATSLLQQERYHAQTRTKTLLERADIEELFAAYIVEAEEDVEGGSGGTGGQVQDRTAEEKIFHALMDLGGIVPSSAPTGVEENASSPSGGAPGVSPKSVGRLSVSSVLRGFKAPSSAVLVGDGRYREVAATGIPLLLSQFRSGTKATSTIEDDDPVGAATDCE